MKMKLVLDIKEACDILVTHVQRTKRCHVSHVTIEPDPLGAITFVFTCLPMSVEVNDPMSLRCGWAACTNHADPGDSFCKLHRNHWDHGLVPVTNTDESGKANRP